MLSLAATAALALADGVGERIADADPSAEAPHAAPAHTGTTIGVLYFDYAGKNAELAPLSKGLAQMLISDLAAVDTIRVVERERLQAVLDEQKLGEAGKGPGRSTAAPPRASASSSARATWCWGRYFDAMGAFRADARLVDVETGQIVKSIGANGKAEDFIGLEQTLADGLCKAAAQLPPPPGSEHGEHKEAEHRGGEHGVAKPPRAALQAAARAQGFHGGDLRQGAGRGRRRRSQAGARRCSSRCWPTSPTSSSRSATSTS